MASKARNSGQLIGNVGKEPEMRYTPKGTPMLTFSVAVERSTKQPDGTWKKDTDWFDFAVFGKLAEWVQRDLQKGTKVLITYRLKKRNIGKDGKNIWVIDLDVQDYEVLAKGKPRSENGGVSDFDTEPVSETEFDPEIPF